MHDISSSHTLSLSFFSFFFFNDTATTEIYTLSLHDALPIFKPQFVLEKLYEVTKGEAFVTSEVGQHQMWAAQFYRSEEHTSELQSRLHLVCRLLLEKKKKEIIRMNEGSKDKYFLYIHRSQVY